MIPRHLRCLYLRNLQFFFFALGDKCKRYNNKRKLNKIPLLNIIPLDHFKSHFRDIFSGYATKRHLNALNMFLKLPKGGSAVMTNMILSNESQTNGLVLVCIFLLKCVREWACVCVCVWERGSCNIHCHTRLEHGFGIPQPEVKPWHHWSESVVEKKDGKWVRVMATRSVCNFNALRTLFQYKLNNT